MERFDQGQLHLKPGTESWPPRWEVGTLAKSFLKSVWIATVFATSTTHVAPPSARGYMNNEHTWTHMSCTIGTSRSTLNIDIRHLQVRVLTVKRDRSCRVHHYGESWPRSSPSSFAWDWFIVGRDRSQGYMVGDDHSSNQLFEHRSHSEHLLMSPRQYHIISSLYYSGLTFKVLSSEMSVILAGAR